MTCDTIRSDKHEQGVWLTTDVVHSCFFAVQRLFVKREVCGICFNEAPGQDVAISCSCFQRARRFSVYDIDLKTTCHFLISRLWSSIKEYKQKIKSNASDGFNDLPFNSVYRKMVKSIGEDRQFISLILHIDGISLCKSTKLSLWLLSGIVLELPPHLRYRRENMLLLSIYVGFCEPSPKFWLSSCFCSLHRMKNEGNIFVWTETYWIQPQRFVHISFQQRVLIHVSERFDWIFFLFRFLLERWNEAFCSFLWNHRRLSSVETHSGIHLTRWILSMLLLLYQGCARWRSRRQEAIPFRRLHRSSRRGELRIRIERSGKQFQQCVRPFGAIDPPRHSRCASTKFDNCRLSPCHSFEAYASHHTPNVHEITPCTKNTAGC